MKLKGSDLVFPAVLESLHELFLKVVIEIMLNCYLIQLFLYLAIGFIFKIYDVFAWNYLCSRNYWRYFSSKILGKHYPEVSLEKSELREDAFGILGMNVRLDDYFGEMGIRLVAFDIGL